MHKSFLKLQLWIVFLVNTLILVTSTLSLAQEPASYQKSHLPGPFIFEVLEVIDGDTFRARIPVWLDQNVVVKIRLRDIDTPEIKGQCGREKKLARQAKEFSMSWLAQKGLRLVNVSYGTYAGRVLATTEAQNGETLSDALLQAGLAQPYRGRKASWCNQSN